MRSSATAHLPGPARTGLAWPGPHRLSPHRPGLARPAPALPAPARLGSASARLGPHRPGASVLSAAATLGHGALFRNGAPARPGPHRPGLA
ncbi:hypothetical protein ACFW59_09730, partial [Streptomyces sp. NPDC058755]